MSQDVGVRSSVAEKERKITITMTAGKPKVVIEGMWDGRLISVASRLVEREYKHIKGNLMRKVVAERVTAERKAASKTAEDRRKAAQRSEALAQTSSKGDRR